jgi:3-phenylpropionate/trans-cinnamate dioxygenase ferredoxin reductase subunit
MTAGAVVVGGGLTGATAALTLRREGFDGPVTLIGTEPHAPYERPPLSKTFLRGESPFDTALVEPEPTYAERDIDLREGSTVVALDLQSRTVALADGEAIPFDRLLLATGARNRRFPIPGLDLPGVLALRTVEEASAIRAAAARGARAVIAGMGFIGSEVAASLRTMGLEVTTVDGGPVPLARVFGESVGSVLASIHRDHGVRMVFGDRVAALEGGDRVERVVTANGERLDCDLAVVGLGVEPVVELGVEAGLAVSNGIDVDERCRTSAPGVFAAGDVANHWHPVFGRSIRVEHWQHAIRHGRAAALNMLGRDAPYAEIHWFWSEQYDRRIEYAGFHTEWDDLVVRGSLETGDFTAFYRKDDRLLAVVAMNRRQDVRRAIPLIAAGGLVDPAALADEGTDLATLAPRAVEHAGP